MSNVNEVQNFKYGYPTPGPQHPTGSTVMDDVFFLSQGKWKDVREKEEFDYIVVGSGFCALGFATCVLQENPLARILILERGPFFLPEHFQSLPLPFQQAIGGMSETFPWTLSAQTVNNPHFIKWQHGMVPFFGGRSTAWSGWCPRPSREEMRGWPDSVIDAANRHFGDAEQLLNVVPANKIGKCRDLAVYGTLQKGLTSLLEENLKKIESATKVMHAPLAVRDPNPKGLDYAKFSTVGPLLSLLSTQSELAQQDKGEKLKILTNCVVSRIIQQDGAATGLETSRGEVNLGKAKLILAMGTLPPTTLVLNSFPNLPNIGKRFTSHFISSIVARIPRADYHFCESLVKDELELGAIYLTGVDPKTQAQYHIQLTALADPDPEKYAVVAGRYMPDVVATASSEQLRGSKGYVVLVCAVLGELEPSSKSWLERNDGQDPTSNVLLQALESDRDLALWDTMDEATFQALERVLSPRGKDGVEYWHSSEQEEVKWQKRRPNKADIRVPGMVHEGSTMHIGGDDDKEAAVGLDYRLKHVKNVYVTGGALWPSSGAWNPTLTMVALAQDLAHQLEGERKKQL